MNKKTNFFENFSKGIAMGIANVIPGVSGGTIALITNIFERLINSLKSFDLKAIKLFFGGKWKEFVQYTDFYFLMSVLAGVGFGIIAFAKLLTFLFEKYPIFVWAFFLGLIAASVYFVAKTVKKWKIDVIISFVVGTAIAVIITTLNPAKENNSFVYLTIAGAVAICSMILPGLSGSYVLVLMGVYTLTLRAVDDLNLSVLVPIAIGCVVGLLAFSHFLSWLFRKFKDQTLAILAGFILGSVSILWPWKHIFDASGNELQINKFGEIMQKGIDLKTVSYKYFLPEIDIWLAIAIVLAFAGFFTIWFMERFAAQKQENQLVETKDN